MAGRIDNGEDLVENHEINVTPFIDVMLVLLIIFMVAAPLSTVDVPVDLPGSTAAPAPRPERPAYLTVKADLSLALGNDPVAEEGLGPALDAFTRGNRDQRIFLRADRTVSYGDLTAVMNALRAAGYLKIALVGLETAPGSGIGPRRARRGPDHERRARPRSRRPPTPSPDFRGWWSRGPASAAVPPGWSAPPSPRAPRRRRATAAARRRPLGRAGRAGGGGHDRPAAGSRHAAAGERRERGRAGGLGTGRRRDPELGRGGLWSARGRGRPCRTGNGRSRGDGAPPRRGGTVAGGAAGGRRGRFCSRRGIPGKGGTGPGRDDHVGTARRSRGSAPSEVAEALRAAEPVAAEETPAIAPAPPLLPTRRPAPAVERKPSPVVAAAREVRPKRRVEAPAAKTARPAAVPPKASAAAVDGRRASGAGRPDPNLLAGYLSSVRADIMRQRRGLDLDGRGRTAVIRFTIDASGALAGVALAASSGDARLDAAAMAMVRRASPVPALPGALGGSLRTRLPVRFD